MAGTGLQVQHIYHHDFAEYPGFIGLYGQDLMLRSFSRIPEDTHHDQSHTTVQLA